MIAVTLSAQILTTPLIFFYFKQFPVFFLFTNLVAVPLSGWILLGELLLCILYPLQGIAIKLGIVLEKSILLLNAYVFRMDSIPFSSIRDIYVLPVQVFLLYMIVFGITFWLRLKLKTGFWIMFSSFLLFSIASLNQNLRIYRQQKLVILNLNGGPALLLVNGKSGVLLTNKPGKANYAVNNNKPETVKQYFKLRNLEKEELPAGGMIQIRQEGRIILLCRDKEMNRLPLPLPKTDFFILSSNTGISMEFLFQKTHCRNWIADGTNSMWKIQEWKREAERLHLRFHSVNESGAFIHDF
jgi:competence protein ComEC